jgi:D-glycero-D-manno-heptose 1,7-bisphosphate phosphatase
MKNQKIKSLFLDRDGVINVDHGYVGNVDALEIYDDVYESLEIAKSLGFMIFVITNQSGVARGYFNLDAVEQIHTEINRRLKAHNNTSIDHFFICPHHPGGHVEPFNKICSCRKPKTGLIQQAVELYPDIDLASCFVIGDKASDIECGLNAGVRGIQITRGSYEKHANPWANANTLLEAMRTIEKQ